MFQKMATRGASLRVVSPHLLLTAALLVVSCPARSDEMAPLTLDAKIPLGKVAGRIDHLTFDPMRSRVYVAELGNNSVGIVDLKSQRVIRTVSGFEEPQGIGYEPTTDTVYVANGGDGSVGVFSASDFAPIGKIALGEDADNVRIDRGTREVYVGYGGGALAIIDAVTRQRVADIPLKGHPESFRLDPTSSNILVNVPDSGHIAVVSREARKQIASWSTGNLRGNFPLTLDADRGRAISVFRHPARLQAYDMRTGQTLGGSDVCADSDDVFFDAKRLRVYVICGQGFVDVLDASGDAYTRVGRLPTSGGSRTGLFVAEIDRVLVAIRATAEDGAALWVYRPNP